MSDPLLDELLAKPVGPQVPARSLDVDRDLTREIEVSENRVTAVLTDEPGRINEGTAYTFLVDEGLNPDDWEVTGFRKSEWGSVDNPMESVRFAFSRRTEPLLPRWSVEEMLAEVSDYEPVLVRPAGSHGFLVLIGDMQFGKIDGDGPAGALKRTIEAINRAADLLLMYRKVFDIGHVHIAWLGDHIEGFVSQGGANVWRTVLTLNEQIRLTRRVMLHALRTFAPLAQTVTMAAVPGNHGESVRFEGTGITRYDDSHDTEALIAVSDAAELVPEAFGHVKFYVPDTDELVVMTEVADTIIAHHHGHKWKPQKHWEWWSDQAFNSQSPLHMADLLVAGHLHHEEYSVQGKRTYWGQPALEWESTWFRHLKGSGGAPAVNVGIVKSGRVHARQTIYLD